MGLETPACGGMPGPGLLEPPLTRFRFSLGYGWLIAPTGPSAIVWHRNAALLWHCFFSHQQQTRARNKRIALCQTMLIQ